MNNGLLWPLTTLWGDLSLHRPLVELRSPTDAITALEDKMAEYMAGGTTLAWLIDPANRRVLVHRQGSDIEELDSPTSISGPSVGGLFDWSWKRFGGVAGERPGDAGHGARYQTAAAGGSRTIGTTIAQGRSTARGSRYRS